MVMFTKVINDAVMHREGKDTWHHEIDAACYVCCVKCAYDSHVCECGEFIKHGEDICEPCAIRFSSIIGFEFPWRNG